MIKAFKCLHTYIEGGIFAKSTWWSSAGQQETCPEFRAGLTGKLQCTGETKHPQREVREHEFMVLITIKSMA